MKKYFIVFLVGVLSIFGCQSGNSTDALLNRVKNAQPEPVVTEEPVNEDFPKQFLEKAEPGDTEAQYQMGRYFGWKNRGEVRGTKEGFKLAKEAEKWFELAGRKDHACSLYRLGMSYNLGLTGKPHKTNAFNNFEKAHKLGNSMASRELASYLYEDKKFSAYAEMILNFAVHTWNVSDLFEGACLFESGKGLPKDLVQAVALGYLAFAACTSDGRAKSVTRTFLEATCPKLSSAEKDKAKDLAIHCLEQTKILGSVDKDCLLGKLLVEAVQSDSQKGLDLLKGAARQGHADAQMWLVSYLLDGVEGNLKPNLAEGMAWLAYTKQIDLDAVLKEHRMPSAVKKEAKTIYADLCKTPRDQSK